MGGRWYMYNLVNLVVFITSCIIRSLFFSIKVCMAMKCRRLCRQVSSGSSFASYSDTVVCSVFAMEPLAWRIVEEFAMSAAMVHLYSCNRGLLRTYAAEVQAIRTAAYGFRQYDFWDRLLESVGGASFLSLRVSHDPAGYLELLARFRENPTLPYAWAYGLYEYSPFRMTRPALEGRIAANYTIRSITVGSALATGISFVMCSIESFLSLGGGVSSMRLFI